MGSILRLFVVYGVVFVTGIPFLFLFGQRLWFAVRGRVWIWDKKRKQLALNAVLYPIFFAIFLFVILKVFGVSDEAQRQFERIHTDADHAIQQGGSPSRNNSLLGILALSVAYFLVALVPAAGVSLIYGLSSTLLIVRSREQSRWWTPFLVSVSLSFALIALGFALRTTVFNLLSDLESPLGLRGSSRAKAAQGRAGSQAVHFPE